MATITYKSQHNVNTKSKGSPMRKANERVTKAVTNATNLRTLFTKELEEPRLNGRKSAFAGQGKALRDIGKNGSAPTQIVKVEEIITDNKILYQLLAELSKLSARKHFDTKGDMIPSSLERLRTLKRQARDLIRSNKQAKLLENMDTFIKSVLNQRPCLRSTQVLLTMRG